MIILYFAPLAFGALIVLLAWQIGKVILFLTGTTDSAIRTFLMRRWFSRINRSRKNVQSIDLFADAGYDYEIVRRLESLLQREVRVPLTLLPEDSVHRFLRLNQDQVYSVVVDLANACGKWWPDVRDGLEWDNDLTIGRIIRAVQNASGFRV